MFKIKETRLHFVGIGGIGMSGIAEVLLNQGYPVSGSDQVDSDTTRRLQSLGATISIGHRAANVGEASVVVISSAVRPDNPEVVEARKSRIPVIPRAEMLGELMRGKTGIAVAGTHGKTTTTSMLAAVLTEAELDPTLVVGGKVNSFGGVAGQSPASTGGNAKLGQGQFVVAEADESDGSFLHLPATFAVVTNIDNDHLDHFGSLAAIEDTFVNFVGKLPFYGVAVVCAEDPGIKRCLGRFSKPTLTYGLTEDCDFRAEKLQSDGRGSSFEIWSGKKKLGKVELGFPGKHNVLNALAVAVIATRLEIPFNVIASGLKAFAGVKRRFELRWKDEALRRAIIDDYGHHPTEILATLAAAKSYWPGRIITVFQPHRYSRTLHCRDGFLAAFHHSDVILITDIYAAGEDPIEGVTGESLAEAVRGVAQPHQQVAFVGTLENAKAEVLKHWKDGDLVLCLGAGSITKLPDLIMTSVE